MNEPIYRRRPDISFREAGGEVFLVGTDGATLFNLNPVGSAIWQLLEEPIDVVETADILAEAFPAVARPRIEADVRAVFADLAGRGLIEAV